MAPRIPRILRGRPRVTVGRGKTPKKGRMAGQGKGDAKLTEGGFGTPYVLGGLGLAGAALFDEEIRGAFEPGGLLNWSTDTDTAPPAPELPPPVVPETVETEETGTESTQTDIEPDVLTPLERSIEDPLEALKPFLDPKYQEKRDREFFKRQLIQNELSTRAGLAKSRERSRREIEQARIAEWGAITRQQIIRDTAIAQQASTAIRSAMPDSALKTFPEFEAAKVQIPKRYVKES